MPLAAGTRIGSYEIVSLLGAGGMGEVFRARDTKLNRDVAIKVLPDSVALDGERRARFDREAQTLAAFNHSRIAQIYGVIELGEGVAPHPGALALVMEYVEGEDLAARLVRGPLPLDDAVAIAVQIAEGLEAAHERGIVHRPQAGQRQGDIRGHRQGARLRPGEAERRESHWASRDDGDCRVHGARTNSRRASRQPR
jgi:aminoglycoside phosphotransferase (APT) family kinase protein